MIRMILFIAALIAVYGIAGKFDYVTEVQAQSDYCAAVQEWRETRGHGGHPDYNGNAVEVCK